jgi:hypothetical protein
MNVIFNTFIMHENRRLKKSLLLLKVNKIKSDCLSISCLSIPIL